MRRFIVMFFVLGSASLLATPGAAAQTAVCGDWMMSDGEVCDDGDGNGQPGQCNATCTGYTEWCGDGTVNGGEVCDEGEMFNGQPGHCDSTCTGMAAAVCGDWMTSGGEVCDDGDSNGQPWSCNATCTGYTEWCGDGTVSGGEVCDEGEMFNGQPGHCNETCTGMAAAVCGDWTTSAGEACDDGDSNGQPYYCNATCSGYTEWCGDGTVNAGETCDEGEMYNGQVGHCDLQCAGITVAPRPLAMRAGAPAFHEDVGMWDATAEFGVSPSGNVQHRVPVLEWQSPGNLAVAVVLYHNSAEGEIQRGAGLGFRVGPAATLEVDGGGVVSVVEADGTARHFTPLAGSFVAAPFDRGRLGPIAGGYQLDEGGGTIRTFTNPNGTGHVETSIRNRLGNTITFSYDAENHLTAITDGAGRSATLARSGGVYTSYTAPNGQALTPVYVGGELRNLRGPAVGGSTPNLALTYTVVAGKHLVASRTTWGGGGWGSPVTSFTYHGDGAFESVGFPDGSTWRLDYGADQVRATDSVGRSTTQLYTGGAVSEVQMPDGRSLYIHRDHLDRPDQVIDVDGHLTRVEYDAQSRVVRSWDPLERLTTFAYDARGNLTATTDPLGRTVSATYNALDQVTASTTVLGETSTFEYDAAGNLIRSQGPFGHSAEATYNALGQVTSMTDVEGRVTTYAYDSNGNWSSVVAPGGLTTTRVADAWGRTLSLTNAAGETTQFAYDELGRAKQAVLPGGGTVSWQTDLDGRVVSTTDATGPRTLTSSTSYTMTHSTASRSINGVMVQQAPAGLAQQPSPVESAPSTPTAAPRPWVQ